MSSGMSSVVVASHADINLTDIKSCKLSSDLKFLALWCVDATVRIFRLGQRCSSLCISESIKCFNWHAGAPSNKFIIVTENLLIKHFAIRETKINCLAHYDLVCEVSSSFDELQRLLVEAKHSFDRNLLQLLDYSEEVPLLWVNGYISRLQLQSFQTFRWHLDFKITSHGEMCTDGLHIVKPYLFVIWVNGIIDAYDLISKKRRVSINLNFSIFYSPYPLQFNVNSRFSISSNLDYFVHLDPSGHAYKISLREWMAELQIDQLKLRGTPSNFQKTNEVQRNRVTGLKEKPNVANSRNTLFQLLNYNGDLVRGFKGTPEYIIFWHSDAEMMGNITAVDALTLTTKFTLRFDEPSFAIFSEYNQSPHLIMTTNKFLALSDAVSPGQVINNFISKGSLIGTVHIAKVNGWKISFTSPAVLSSCLKCQNLEYVSYYLKSHEFDKETLMRLTNDQLLHFQEIIQLLNTSVKENLSDQSSRMYGEQLLKVSLDYLMRLLKAVAHANCNFLINVIMDNLNDVRKLLEEFPSLTEFKNESPNDVSQFWKEWLQLDKLNIIRSGLKSKHFSLVQTFFLYNSFDNADLCNTKYTLDSLSPNELKLVEDHLNNDDVNSAFVLLTSLGCDASEKLKNIYFRTTNRKYRKSLEDYFIDGQWISSEEQQLITKFHFLEEKYSCQSIITSLDMINNLKLWDNEDLAYLSSLFDSPKRGSVAVQRSRKSVGNIKSPTADKLYCCTMLDWTKSWTQDTWERILIESLVCQSDANFFGMISDKMVWDYFLLHNRTDMINVWMRRISNSNIEKTLFCDHFLDAFISQEMIEKVGSLIPHFASFLLDDLARFGMFSLNELNTFPLLMKRIGRISDKAHVVTIVSIPSFSQKDFFERLVKYCLNQNLPSVLWSLIDKFKIPLDFLNCISSNSITWLKLMVHFKQWSENPTDRNSIYLASLSNAEHKIQSLIDISDIFKYDLVGFTSLLYSSGSLRSNVELNTDVLRNELSLAKSDENDDWRYLLGFLCSIIDRGETVLQDVSVYDLLKENLPLEVVSLFGWQNSNNHRSPDGYNDLPNFSNIELMKKFGNFQELDFTYYLKQGRPFFAYVKFITYCTAKQGKVSLSLINRACNIAHSMAIEHFYSPLTTSSCVVFMELLNCNTQGLRIDLEVLQLILKYRNSATLSKGTSSEAELAALMKGGMYGEVEKLLVLLKWAEESMVAYIEANEIASFSVCALHHWSLLNLFCQKHNLPNTVMFLKICAEAESWIPFLLYADIFQYSRNEVWQVINQHGRGQTVVHIFNLVAHLCHYNCRRETKMIEKLRSTRNSLYSKVGLEATVKAKVLRDNSDDTTDSFVGESSDDVTDRSSSSSLNSVFNAVDTLASSDILLSLLQSGRQPCPWKSLLSQAIEINNSILAIFAACYQEAHLLECLYVWILASISNEEKDYIDQLNSGKSSNVEMLDLFEIIRYLIGKGSVCVLTEAFYYFLPDYPLYNLFVFLKTFLVEKIYDNSIAYLKNFQLSFYSLKTLDSNLQISESVLKDFCIEIIDIVLVNMTNRRERSELLNILSSTMLSDIWEASVTSKYSLLHSLEELFSSMNISYNLFNLLRHHHENEFIEECRSILNYLVEEKKFSVADQFVTLVEYPKHEVLLAQLDSEINSRLRLYSKSNLNAKLLIWKQYYLQLKEAEVPSINASDFFKKFAFQAEDSVERYFIFRLAWLTISWTDAANVFDEEVECEMWLARIKAEFENDNNDLPEILFDRQLDYKCPMKTSKQILNFNNCSQTNKHLILNLDKEWTILERLIGIELDRGNVDIAYRLSLMFDAKCLPLSVILSCMKLAEGLIAEEEMDEELSNLLEDSREETIYRSLYRKHSPIISKNSHDQITEKGESEKKSFLYRQRSDASSSSSEFGNILKIMKKCLDFCKVGEFSLFRVITFYKISLVLKLNYDDIILNRPYSDLLEELLQINDVSRFSLAKDLISATALDDSILASILCVYFTKTLSKFANEDCRSCREVANSAEVSASLNELAKLCEDQSLLAKLLLDNVITETTDITDFVVSVELCITSHSCYTAACHVGGITKLLQTVKILARQLASAGEFSLMVRLLTGIGRFSEMPYVFDFLRNNHRFELLFKKGMEKVPGFKLAILDYMKRFHPNDTEMFTMTALHFRMYREIAETLEFLANSQLQNLNIVQLSKESLDIILQYLADAAESYIKAECLQHALTCTKQAELIALQIYLLQYNSIVLNLKSYEITNFIVNNSSFNEAYIVAEAYGQHQDWALALFTNYILKCNEHYLMEFCNKFQLSTIMLEEIARRYRFSKEALKSSKSASNMKNLLNKVDDVQMKYILSNECGFVDI